MTFFSKIKAFFLKLSKQQTEADNLRLTSQKYHSQMEECFNKQETLLETIAKLENELNLANLDSNKDLISEKDNQINSIKEEDEINASNKDSNWESLDYDQKNLTQEREIVSEKDKNTKQRAILIKPTDSKEAKIIAKRLMENNIVVLNLENTSDVDFKRIKDFVSGTLFSLNGDYKKINLNTAVLLPSKNVDKKYLDLVLKKAKEMNQKPNGL